MALLGSETPRVFTPPLRPLTPDTTLGYALIAFAEMIGVPLLPWQRWLAIHMLELLPSGRLRFRTVVLLVARQNGKSTFAQVLGLFFLYVRQVPLVLSTAQNLDIAEEVWAGAVEMAKGDDELAGLVSRVVLQRGSKAFELTTGARWKVQAATRRGGRGLSGDLVLLDELREHQTWDAWGAISKTTLAREDAVVFALSNAGDVTSVVLAHLRRMAHRVLGDPDGLWVDVATGERPEEGVDLPDDDSLAIFEWSATPGVDVWDRAGWRQANPSLGHTITEAAIAAAASTDSEWVFRTEVLCQWFSGAVAGTFPSGSWAAGTDPDSAMAADTRVCYGVSVSWDRQVARVAWAGYRDDGQVHVEVVASRPGTDWVVDWLTHPDRRRTPAAVAWQSAGARVSSLTDSFEGSGLPLAPWGGADLGRGVGQFFDLVARRDEKTDEPRPGVFHRPSPALDVAANTALLSPSGLWDARRSPADSSPIEAVNAAVWALLSYAEPTVSAYDAGASFAML